MQSTPRTFRLANAIATVFLDYSTMRSRISSTFVTMHRIPHIGSWSRTSVTMSTPSMAHTVPFDFVVSPDLPPNVDVLFGVDFYQECERLGTPELLVGWMNMPAILLDPGSQSTPLPLPSSTFTSSQFFSHMPPVPDSTVTPITRPLHSPIPFHCPVANPTPRSNTLPSCPVVSATPNPSVYLCHSNATASTSQNMIPVPPEPSSQSIIDCILHGSARTGVRCSSFLPDVQPLSNLAALHGINAFGFRTARDATTAILNHLFSGMCTIVKSRKEGCRLTGQDYGTRVLLSQAVVRSAKSCTLDVLLLVTRSVGLVLDRMQTRAQGKAYVMRRLREYSLSLTPGTAGVPPSLHTVKDTFHNFENLGVPALTAIADIHGINVSRFTGSGPTIRDEIVSHFVEGTCIANKGSGGVGCQAINEVYHPEGETDLVDIKIEILRDMLERSSNSVVKRALKVLDVNRGCSTSNAKTVLRDHLSSLNSGESASSSDPVSDPVFSPITHPPIDSNSESSWPPDVSPAFFESLISRFHAATSSEALREFTCAVCGEDRPCSEKTIVPLSDIDVSLLHRPDRRYRQSDSDDVIVDPFWLENCNMGALPQYDNPRLQDSVLDERGLHVTGNEVRLQTCRECRMSLSKGKVPALALANHMLLGDVPPELQDLTVVEEAMIARVRAKVWVLQFKEDRETSEKEEKDMRRNAGGVQGNLDKNKSARQRGFRGHIMVYPQEPGKVADILPPSVKELTSPICVLFIGSTKPTEEWLKSKATPLYVRAHKVRAALIWLKENNPLYKSIEIDYDMLSALPTEFVLPVHIEVTPPNKDLDVLTSRYDIYDNAPDSEESNSEDTHAHLPYPFQSIVITDVDLNANAYDLKAAAIKHVLEDGLPYYEHAHGPEPVNEFYNPDLFPMMYPTLFPYGIGGFEDAKRTVKVSIERQVKHYFRLADRRFQEHYSFHFTAFNMIQRREILRRTSYKMKQSGFESFAIRASSVTIDSVKAVSEKLATNNSTQGFTPEENEVVNLMREVNVVTSTVPGSSASKSLMRKQIRGLQISHGLPTFYITVNPADSFNPIVRFLAGQDFDVDRFLPGDGPNYHRDSQLIAKNPAVGAKFFDLYMRTFIEILLGYDVKSRKGNPGVFGVVKSFFGTVENQGRGSLHCHMLVWIEGALNTNQIRDRVVLLQDESFQARLIKYLDEAIATSLPPEPRTDFVLPSDHLNPVSVRGVPADIAARHGLVAVEKDYFNLAKGCQTHDHRPTCYKYWKRGSGKPKVCRFELAEFREVVPFSSIDSDTGELHLRHLDPLINNYNPTILRSLRCNMDIKFVGSGGSAKALTHYITDYITKSQLKAHVAYGTMESAMKRFEEKRETLADTASVGRALLQKCSFALVGRQELSGQQVISYLMDYGDFYTSHEFKSFYWNSFEHAIESQLSISTLESHVADSDGEGSRPSNGETDDPETNDDTVIRVRLDVDGKLSKKASLLDDYRWRASELADLSLWDMVSSVDKMRIPKNKLEVSPTEGDLDVDADDPMNMEDADCAEIPLDDDSRIRPKYKFLSSHPGLKGRHAEVKTHCLQIRNPKLRYIPVPIGQPIPRRDREEVYPRYCRLMLIFFKPWRTAQDLKLADQTWIEAFDLFVQSCAPRYKTLMENMHLQHECKDSRDDHFAERESARRMRPRTALASTNVLDDDFCFDSEQLADHIEAVQSSRSIRDAVAAASIDNCVRTIAQAGFIGDRLSAGTPVKSAFSHHEISPDEEELEDVWKGYYDESRKRWRKNASAATPNTSSATASVDSSLGLAGVDTVSGISTGCSTTRESGIRQDVQGTASSSAPDIDGFLDQYSPPLNRRQKRAFRIIAEHSLKPRTSALRMYLGGAGGTGKSHVINAVKAFFEARNQPRRFRLSSYTGIAARNISGMTLHSALCMGQKTTEQLNSSSDLVAMWEGVDYLFVDEVSMIGCHFMLNISKALGMAKQNKLPFGGINIIFAGDFAQLPPVLDTRLFAKIKSERVGTSRGQDAVYGKLLWMSIDTVVILTEQMRQSGQDNAFFVELLGRLRVGKCTEEDYEVLQDRLLCKVNPDPTTDDWNNAPIIVSSNKMKDELNVHLAEAYARRTGEELHWYYASDSYGRAEVTDERLLHCLGSLDSGKTSQRLYKIPLARGMPVIVGHNFDVGRGVVNGTIGSLDSVRYRLDALGRRHATSCVVDAPSTTASEPLPHLTDGKIVALETKVSIKIVHPDTGKRASFTRVQVPIVPAFAITAHKAQGQTLSHVIVDLADCRGTEEPYVMISRVKSLEGLIILRPFSKTKICSRPSEDSRTEMARLNFLDLKTSLDRGDPEEKHAANYQLASFGISPGDLSVFDVNPHDVSSGAAAEDAVNVLQQESIRLATSFDREEMVPRKRPFEGADTNPTKRVRYTRVSLTQTRSSAATEPATQVPSNRYTKVPLSPSPLRSNIPESWSTETRPKVIYQRVLLVPPLSSTAPTIHRSLQDYLSNTIDHEGLRARVEPGGALCSLPKNIDLLGDNWAGNAAVEDFTSIDQPNTYTKNYVNVNAAGEEKVFLYLGEILGFAQGTALAPFGNFSIPEKGNPKAMDDDSVVKQIIVLGKPSFGDEYINGCFTNQVVALHEAISAEGDSEKALNQSFASVRPPYKHIAANTSDPPDALIFHTERLYELPPAARAAAAKAAATGTKVLGTPKYEKVALKRPLDASGEPSSAPPEADAPKADAAPPSQIKKLEVGDYLDPTCLPGYGGPLCKLVQSKVSVPDFRKSDGSLANPSEHYAVIAPGTLVWISAVLKAWIYFDKEKRLKRKFYHLCITSIDVLDATPFPVKKPEVRLSIRPIANMPSPRKVDAGNAAARSLLRSGKSEDDAPTSSPSSSVTASSSGDVEMEDSASSSKRARKGVPRR